MRYKIGCFGSVLLFKALSTDKLAELISGLGDRIPLRHRYSAPPRQSSRRHLHHHREATFPSQPRCDTPIFSCLCIRSRCFHSLTLFFCVFLKSHSLSLSVQTRSNLVMRERKCDIAGTRKNSKAMNVSKSHMRTHRTQEVNLQTRKLWWEEGNKFVRVRICTRTLKTIQKNGLDATAKKFGVNLNKFAMSGGTAPAKVAA